jgi:Legume lectin domain/PEP-CTERM motif
LFTAGTLLAWICLATTAQATVLFNFPDFSSSAGLTMVGNAALTGGPLNQLQITPAALSQAGAAYSTSAVTLGASDTFSTTFQFQFTNPGGTVGSPADGITFVLAASPNGLGSGGGALGYAGVPNSVAIEFDTYDNTPYVNDGYSSNHVAILTNGNVGPSSDSNLINPYGVSVCNFFSSNQYTAPGCMSNGNVWSATIGYNGADLSVTVQDGAGPAFTVYNSLPIDIASLIGTTSAYVGFTGGTGAGFEQQNILNWQLANDTSLGPPISVVPEPETYAMLLAGLGLIGFTTLQRKHKFTA